MSERLPKSSTDEQSCSMNRREFLISIYRRPAALPVIFFSLRRPLPNGCSYEDLPYLPKLF